MSCTLYEKLSSETPAWMLSQVQRDLAPVRSFPISLSKINQFYEKNSNNNLVKFTIFNNQILLEKNCSNNLLQMRGNPVLDALITLSHAIGLPNVTFLLSLEDGVANCPHDIPLFCMAKNSTKTQLPLILFPDSEVLQQKYQVLLKTDVTSYAHPWHEKIPQLIWRGSTAQYSFLNPAESYIRQNNLNGFSRIKLCELSLRYPSLIDAKFTLYSQGGDLIPYLLNFRGDWVNYSTFFDYKYHILIDGNSCPWSYSGWKLFTNSLVFKADSDWIQWYYPALKPNIHYIAVKNNLSDLTEKLVWALHNDESAQAIAARMYQFAKENLTTESSLVYIYLLLNEYSKLQFVN